MSRTPSGLPSIWRRVRFDQIEDYLRMGWMMEDYPPTIFHYQHNYGIFMYWLCHCPLPQLTKDSLP